MAKFLIVDDEPTCGKLLKAVLSPYGACDVVRDGYEAIGAFRLALERGEPYDLVSLDIMMPGMDGHQVLAAIRRLETERGVRASSGVKVLMTTAMLDSQHCVQAFREGCEAYVTKPIHEEDLLAQVHAVLGELPRQSESSAPTASGGLTSVPTAPGSPQSGRGIRCLIVDDDHLCCELLKDMLSPFAQCDFAYDGAEAVEAVRLAMEDGNPYEFVCLDIMMPGTSGHDALQAIRNTEAKHGVHGSDGVKVVMVTALRDAKHCVRAFREGCEAFVTKPVRKAELLTALSDLGVNVGSEAIPFSRPT